MRTSYWDPLAASEFVLWLISSSWSGTLEPPLLLVKRHLSWALPRSHTTLLLPRPCTTRPLQGAASLRCLCQAQNCMSRAYNPIFLVAWFIAVRARVMELPSNAKLNRQLRGSRQWLFLGVQYLDFLLFPSQNGTNVTLPPLLHTN